jgi:hypothetical protein
MSPPAHPAQRIVQLHSRCESIVTEHWQRRALYLSGAWNVIGGASALANPDAHLAQFYTTTLSLNDPLQAFFFRTTWINAIAWGVGYAMAGRFASARLPVLAAGGGGKVAYCVACIGLFATGAGNAWLLATGIADVVFAAVFAAILLHGARTNR